MMEAKNLAFEKNIANKQWFVPNYSLISILLGINVACCVKIDGYVQINGLGVHNSFRCFYWDLNAVLGTY